MAKIKRTYFTEDATVIGILDRLQRKCAGKEYSDVIDAAGNQYVDLVASFA